MTIRIYTVLYVDKRGVSRVLYSGTDKNTADEVRYFALIDEPAPGKHRYMKWQIIVTDFHLPG